MNSRQAPTGPPIFVPLVNEEEMAAMWRAAHAVKAPLQPRFSPGRRWSREREARHLHGWDGGVASPSAASGGWAGP